MRTCRILTAPSCGRRLKRPLNGRRRRKQEADAQALRVVTGAELDPDAGWRAIERTIASPMPLPGAVVPGTR